MPGYWRTRKKSARSLLRPRGRGSRSAIRKSVLALLGHHFTRPKMRALCKVLGVVDDEAAERGEPELAVLVVRQSDGLPGQGWWVAGGAANHGYEGLWEGPEAKKLVKRLQGQAFDYWRARG